jgi:single-strand DNA-binding protein
MNKVILMGRLTRDPEVRYTQNTNLTVANFSIAVNRRFKREGDTETADFFNVVAWNKTGEFVGKYFKKGQQVIVSGRLQNRNWTDQQGVKHYATDVIAEEVEFADSKKNSDSENFNNTFGNVPESAEGNAQSSDDNSDFTVSSGDDLPF